MRYKLVLLISGGIGITPMQSVCNQLIDEHERGRPLDLIWFTWTCRDQRIGHHFAAKLGGDGSGESATPPAAFKPDDDRGCFSGGAGTFDDDMEQDHCLPIWFQPNMLKYTT